MQDTNVGADPDQPQFVDLAFAQVVVQIGVLKGRVAVFVELVDAFVRLVGIVPVLDGTV